MHYGSYKLYYSLLYACIHAHVCHSIYVVRGLNVESGSLLSPCVGPKDQTQIVRLGGKHLYPLSHSPAQISESLAGPNFTYIYFELNIFLRPARWLSG